MPKKISEETIAQLKKRSAFALPDNPSASGMKPAEIKKFFWSALLSNFGSIITEINRIVGEVDDERVVLEASIEACRKLLLSETVSDAKEDFAREVSDVIVPEAIDEIEKAKLEKISAALADIATEVDKYLTLLEAAASAVDNREEVLWQNPAPEDSFSNGIIDVSERLTDEFDHVRIVFLAGTDEQFILPSIELERGQRGRVHINDHSREFFITEAGTIEFEDAMPSNSGCIPYKICSIKNREVDLLDLMRQAEEQAKAVVKVALEDLKKQIVQTTHIKDGYWWIGDTNTNVKAEGKDGYTPVKGADYFTEDDKAEIVGELVGAAPVKSVNGKTGVVSLDAEDVGARPNTWTPSYSDVGADKSGAASSAVSAHNTSATAHADIREEISQLSSEIADLPNNELLVQNVAQKVPYVKVAEPPTFVDSVDEMTDISKMYVLKSDGMFYSYKAHTTTTPGGTFANFTNKVPTSIDESGAIYNGVGYKYKIRLSSSGVEKEEDFGTAFGYIPVSGGDTIRSTGQEHNGNDVIWYNTESNTNYICVYDKDFKFLYAGNSKGAYNTSSFVESMSLDGAVSVIKLKDVANIAYFRLSVQSSWSPDGIIGESAIITVNEEITYTTTEEGTTTTYSWEPTGILYNQPADYEHRVIAMENELEVLLNGTF